jgi:hypothetical protein
MLLNPNVPVVDSNLIGPAGLFLTGKDCLPRGRRIGYGPLILREIAERFLGAL